MRKTQTVYRYASEIRNEKISKLEPKGSEFKAIQEVFDTQNFSSCFNQ